MIIHAFKPSRNKDIFSEPSESLPYQQHSHCNPKVRSVHLVIEEAFGHGHMQLLNGPVANVTLLPSSWINVEVFFSTDTVEDNMNGKAAASDGAVAANNWDTV